MSSHEEAIKSKDGFGLNQKDSEAYEEEDHEMVAVNLF